MTPSQAHDARAYYRHVRTCPGCVVDHDDARLCAWGEVLWTVAFVAAHSEAPAWMVPVSGGAAPCGTAGGLSPDGESFSHTRRPTMLLGQCAASAGG